MNNPAIILVVDDNPTNLKLAADVLECEGYLTERARSAAEAKELLRHRLPDLILMDIQMPGMDGLTFTRLLKQDPAYAQLRIVALTAFAMKGDDNKALDAGCAGYITKPIETRKLAALVAGFLHSTAPASTGDTL